jgi:hypothetical protein
MLGAKAVYDSKTTGCVTVATKWKDFFFGSRAALSGTSGDLYSWSAVPSIPGMRLIHRRNYASCQLRTHAPQQTTSTDCNASLDDLI